MFWTALRALTSPLPERGLLGRVPFGVWLAAIHIVPAVALAALGRWTAAAAFPAVMLTAGVSLVGLFFHVGDPQRSRRFRSIAARRGVAFTWMLAVTAVLAWILVTLR